MRRLARNVCLLAVPVALLVLAVVRGHAPGGVRFISAHRYQVDRAVAMGASLRAVALGDSHAALGFRPEDPTVYSLAFPGERLSETALKAQFVMTAVPRLRTVALQAQPHMLTMRRAGEPRPEYRELFGGTPAPASWWALARDPCCRSELVVASFRDLLDAPFGRLVPDVAPNGFAEYPDSWRREDLAAAAQEELRGPLTLDGQMIAAYREVVRTFRERGLDVVLTRFPLAAAYRSLAGNAMSEADRILRALERSVGARRCGAWDAMSDERWFLNADHLTAAGAAHYWRATLSACLAPPPSLSEGAQREAVRVPGSVTRPQD